MQIHGHITIRVPLFNLILVFMVLNEQVSSQKEKDSACFHAKVALYEKSPLSKAVC